MADGVKPTLSELEKFEEQSLADMEVGISFGVIKTSHINIPLMRYFGVIHILYSIWQT